MKIKKIASLVLCMVMLMSIIPLETAFAAPYISWMGDAFSANNLYYDDDLQSWKRHKDGYVSLYDSNGNRYFKEKAYDVVGLDEKGTKLISSKNSTKIVDKSGNLIKDFGDDDAFEAGYGYVHRYNSAGQYQLYNSKGYKVIAAGQYDYGNPVARKRVIVCDASGKYGMINNVGELIIPVKFNDIKYVSDERILVKNSSGYWGIIDINCNSILACMYTKLDYISDSRILASKSTNGCKRQSILQNKW